MKLLPANLIPRLSSPISRLKSWSYTTANSKPYRVEENRSARNLLTVELNSHQTYVTNLNKAIETYNVNPLQSRFVVLAALNFHGGGHINHSLFWENLSPASSPDASPDAAPKLIAEITRIWGSLDHFKAAFNTALLGITGSGWGWLVKDDVTGLGIVTTKDQDPVTKGVPIFGVDMWEHAYYLQVRPHQ